jgi:calcium-dependent protein kinase
MKNVAIGEYKLKGQAWDHRSEESKSLIRQLMEKNEKKRLSAADALKHPWFEKKIHMEFDVNLAKETLNNL